MPSVIPFALKDAPALIETVFPAQKVSFEAQRERKAGAGQTLTALGSYWKGRKPLILVEITASVNEFSTPGPRVSARRVGSPNPPSRVV